MMSDWVYWVGYNGINIGIYRGIKGTSKIIDWIIYKNKCWNEYNGDKDKNG